MTTSVVIHGLYGYRIVGEEAILRVILRLVKRTFGETKIYSLSEDPEWSERFHGTKALSKKPYSFRSVLALTRSQSLIIGGGERNGFLGILAYGWVILAKVFRKKVFYLGVGILPERRRGLPVNPVKYMKKNSKLKIRFGTILKWILDSCEYISVRDDSSRRILLNLGLKPKKIRLQHDLALHLEASSKERISAILEKEEIDINKRPIIGVSLKNFVDDKINNRVAEEISRILNGLIEECDAQIVFLSFCRNPFVSYDDDTLISLKVYRRIERKENYKAITFTVDPSDVKGIIKELDLLIGMRFHSVVFSYSEGVPTFALIYDLKVNEFCKRYGVAGSYLEDLSSIKVEQLLGILKEDIGSSGVKSALSNENTHIST